MRFCVAYLLIGLVLSACSSSRGTTIDDTGDRAPTMSEVLQHLPEYETFDESSYPAEPPVVDVIVEHDVPEELLAGSVGINTSGLQKGWRIQVVFAREKSIADEALEEVHGWLSNMSVNNPTVEVFQQNLPVYNVYLQPYFRVRIGDFKSREEAEELLALMILDYPRAFIVVDQINVQR